MNFFLLSYKLCLPGCLVTFLGSILYTRKTTPAKKKSKNQTTNTKQLYKLLFLFETIVF